MLKNNTKKLKFILFGLLIILLLINNFFKNFKNLYLNNYEKRIDKVYGFCEGESIGYLIYLKKNFKLDNNPKIINYQAKGRFRGEIPKLVYRPKLFLRNTKVSVQTKSWHVDETQDNIQAKREHLDNLQAKVDSGTKCQN